MTATWAATWPRRDASALAELWDLPHLEVCDAHDLVWVRGPRYSHALDERLRKLSGATLFRADSSGLLTPQGCLLPTQRLPAGPWRMLQSWIDVHLPAATWPGRVPERTPICIIKAAYVPASESCSVVSALLVPLERFAAYADLAPAIRMRYWTFAVDVAGRALVRGMPLPPIPGEHVVDHAGILVPAGYHWSPAVDCHTLRTVLQLADGDVALFDASGDWQLIAGEHFVAATRSAIRATFAAFQLQAGAR